MLSVCLLTYNRAQVLARTLDSILTQSITDFELVINDNCSTDRTEEICRRYAQQDPRIRYFRNSANVGFPANMNLAVERSTGEYIAMVHDGDIYAPRLLECWKAALDKYPTAALVFNAATIQGSSGSPVRLIDHCYMPLIEGRKLHSLMLGMLTSPIWGIVMLRRSCLLRVGRFDETVYISDVDMWFRLMLEFDVAYVPERLYAIYPKEHNHAAVRKTWRTRQDVAKVYRAACDRFYTGSCPEWEVTRAQIERLLIEANLLELGNSLISLRLGSFVEGVIYSCRDAFHAVALLRMRKTKSRASG